MQDKTREAVFLFDTKRDDEAAEIVPYKKFNCSTQDLYLVETETREPTIQTTLALGLLGLFGFPSRERTRASDVQAELAWDPSALTSIGECVVNRDRNKIEKSNDDGHRSFRAVPELCAAQKPDP